MTFASGNLPFRFYFYFYFEYMQISRFDINWNCSFVMTQVAHGATLLFCCCRCCPIGMEYFFMHVFSLSVNKIRFGKMKRPQIIRNVFTSCFSHSSVLCTPKTNRRAWRIHKGKWLEKKVGRKEKRIERKREAKKSRSDL